MQQLCRFDINLQFMASLAAHSSHHCHAEGQADIITGLQKNASVTRTLSVLITIACTRQQRVMQHASTHTGTVIGGYEKDCCILMSCHVCTNAIPYTMINCMLSLWMGVTRMTVACCFMQAKEIRTGTVDAEEEVAHGLQSYFDKALLAVLLYRQERGQAAHVSTKLMNMNPVSCVGILCIPCGYEHGTITVLQRDACDVLMF